MASELIDVLQIAVRWSVLASSVCLCIMMFHMVFSTVGVDIRDVVFDALERKKTGKNPTKAERESRLRVNKAISNASLSVKEKCTFLNDELAQVTESIFVSREWKDEICSRVDTIMKENGLTMADFF